MDRHSKTVTNVVESCVYIRRRFYAISLMRGELQLSRSLLLPSLFCNTTKIRTLVRQRGGQGIQAWTLQTSRCLKCTNGGSRGQKETLPGRTMILGISGFIYLALVYDQGYGRGGTPIFTGVFEPLARVALYPTDEDG